jgi:hypothetical protein
MAFPAPIVRAQTNRQSNLIQTSPGNEQRRHRTRKIFVFKQVQRLPAANAPDRTIRRVLVFDNHPDSLHLVFGLQANRSVASSESQRASVWEFILVATLAFALVFGMFWPLF